MKSEFTKQEVEHRDKYAVLCEKHKNIFNKDSGYLPKVEQLSQETTEELKRLEKSALDDIDVSKIENHFFSIMTNPASDQDSTSLDTVLEIVNVPWVIN